MTRAAEYVIDTNALYWHMTASPRLSAAAGDVFREAAAGRAVLILSYVVLAELCYLLQKRGEGGRFLPYVLRMQASPAYRFEPIPSLIAEFSFAGDRESRLRDSHSARQHLASVRLFARAVIRHRQEQLAFHIQKDLLPVGYLRQPRDGLLVVAQAVLGDAVA